MSEKPPQFVPAYADADRGGYVWTCPTCLEPQVALTERVKNLELTCLRCQQKFVGRVVK